MSDKCAIWGTPARTTRTGVAMMDAYESPRAGGMYRMDFFLRDYIPDEREAPFKARLTTWLVNQRERGDPCPMITQDDIEAARKGQNMRVPQRADRVLHSSS